MAHLGDKMMGQRSSARLAHHQLRPSFMCFSLSLNPLAGFIRCRGAQSLICHTVLQ
jgi:hypothetical protein